MATLQCIVYVGFLLTGISSKAIREEEDRALLEQDLNRFQGDIDYPLPSSGSFRNAIIGEHSKYPDNTVPYEFLVDEGYTYEDWEKNTILDAMQSMEKELSVDGKKCLTFRPKKEGDRGYLFFVNGKNSRTCHASVGQPYYPNYVSLGRLCMHKGTIHHELMHALGFYHEQSRPDRDDYVTIHWENIQSGGTAQFKKYEPTKVTTYGEPYDYDSIMHYGPKYFSANGKPTITPNQPVAYLGQREKMSIYDIRKIQKRYGCAVAPLPTTTPKPTTTTVAAGTVFVDCNFDPPNWWCGGGHPGRFISPLWQLNTQSTAQGPSADHTTGSGNFASLTVKQGSGPVFSYFHIGKLERDQAGYCAHLYYYMNGESMGTLSFARSSQLIGVFFSVSGNQGPGWKEARFYIQMKEFDPRFELHVVGTFEAGQHGVIAIDDLKIERGNC